MRPDGLNAFPMGHPNFIHVGEISSRLARLAMTDEMKLGNRNTERTEGIDIERLQVGRCRQTTGEIYSPLTTNVVGDDDVFDPSLNVVCEGRHNGIINIGIPECRGQWAKGWCEYLQQPTFHLFEGQQPLSDEQKHGDTKRRRHR